MSPRDEIARLREQIHEHDTRYYVDAKPTISDREYDALFQRLKELEADHPNLITPDSPTQRVSELPLDGFEHVTHAVPMLSIDNTYNEGQVREWAARVAKGLEDAACAFIVDPKVDGVSASLRYENGGLVLGATRGDGKVGDDVTANIKTIRAIPLRLRGKGWPDFLEIRGEVYWPRKQFDDFNLRREKEGDEPFANPRNATAGTLKSLDSKAIADRGLAFVAHGSGEIRGGSFDSASQLFAAMKSWGIPISPHQHVYRDIDGVIDFIHAWDNKRHSLEYETDGVVVKVDRFDQRDTLGVTSRYPRWCIAYKYAAEQVETKLIGLEFQVGKFGTITPRAVMAPIQLGGTTVSYASVHNSTIAVTGFGLGQDDIVKIEKAGEIIPQIVEVTQRSSKKRYEHPTICPVCKTSLEIDPPPNGKVAFICKNGSCSERFSTKVENILPSNCRHCGMPVTKVDRMPIVRCPNPNCPAQLKERLRFFCGRDQMDIEGLGEVLIEKLVDAGLLKSYADVYALTDLRDKLINLEIQQERSGKDCKKTIMVPLGDKRADTILGGIEASKKQTLARVLAALNIRHVGAATAEVLADHFLEMKKIAEADEDALQAVDGVGPEVAKSLRHFFKSVAGDRAWQALAKAGVNMTQPQTKRSGPQPFAGKTLVVTGTLTKFSRSEIEKLIKELGGKTSGSVSKKTDYLVVGEDAGSKLDKAKALGVKTLTESEFVGMLLPGSASGKA